MVKKYNLNILKNNKEAIDIISYLARIRFNGLSRNEKLKDNTSIKKKDINAYCKEYGFATVDGIYKE